MSHKGHKPIIIPMTIPNPGQDQDRREGAPKGTQRGARGEGGEKGRKRPREKERERDPPRPGRRGTATRPQEGEKGDRAARDRGDNKIETARNPTDAVITTNLPSHAS